VLERVSAAIEAASKLFSCDRRTTEAGCGIMLSYIIHVGYLLMLVAFVARDALLLRALLAVGQAVITLYAWSVGVPAIAIWNGLFVGINGVWVVTILRDRRRVRIPVELQPLYERHFAALGARDFLRWWALGSDETLRDARLTWIDRRPKFLYFLRSGLVRISRGEEIVTELPGGFFVGEMSLITGRPANADADALGTVHVRQWSTMDLDALRAREPALWVKVQSVIGLDLVEKVRRRAGAGAD
jgi:hypothetical protein